MSRKILHYGSEENRRFLGSKNLELMRRKGLRHVGTKAFYQYMFWYLYPVFKPKCFMYEGQKLPYFNHRHNNAHGNERTVEVAVAMDALRKFKGKNILEVGNVLSHYSESADWEIVDKYEKHPNVFNCDILDYHPDKRYDLIVSISTVEHIGFDEEQVDKTKARAALDHMFSLLEEEGLLLITFPLGWNPDLDRDFHQSKLHFTHVTVFQKANWRNLWNETAANLELPVPYGSRFGADFLVIGTIKKDTKSASIAASETSS